MPLCGVQPLRPQSSKKGPRAKFIPGTALLAGLRAPGPHAPLGEPSWGAATLLVSGVRLGPPARVCSPYENCGGSFQPRSLLPAEARGHVKRAPERPRLHPPVQEPPSAWVGGRPSAPRPPAALTRLHVQLRHLHFRKASNTSRHFRGGRPPERGGTAPGPAGCQEPSTLSGCSEMPGSRCGNAAPAPRGTRNLQLKRHQGPDQKALKGAVFQEAAL